ncbi:MAG: amidohydrolase, partial [Oscillospiraceae bacterium]
APWLGRSALDACELMNVGVNYLREHVSPEARMHYAYVDAGGGAPNIVQDHAKLKYFIRSPQISQVVDICHRVEDIAKGAALMTGTEVTTHFPAGMCDYIANDSLSEILSCELLWAGAPDFSQEDYQVAEKFYALLSKEEIDISLKKAADCYDDWQKLQSCILVDSTAPYRRSSSYGFGSTDVGDVSYCTPTAQLNLACYANGTPAHSWLLTAQGKSGAMHKALIKAGQILAATAVSLMESPQVLAKAKEEYVHATGGKYLCPVGKEEKIDF